MYSAQNSAKIVHTTSSDSSTIQQTIQTPIITFNMAESKRVHIEKAQNFMRQYRDPESRELKKLSANQVSSSFKESYHWIVCRWRYLQISKMF